MVDFQPDSLSNNIVSTKRVVLCADDFGISPSVSKSICNLVEKKRISATSAMVVYNDQNQYHRSLLNFKDHLDIGLHFVLTESRPVSPPENISSIVGPNNRFLSINQFMKCSWLGQINRNHVQEELNMQYEKFVDYFGSAPDYIDGHHHVHQFPTVRDVIIEFVKRKKIEKTIYLRNTAHTLDAILKRGSDIIKAALISAPGLFFKKKLLENGIRTNEAFDGVYNLNCIDLFEKRIIDSFKSIGKKNSIVMVHPGKVDSILRERDSFLVGRENEENFLLQESFFETLKNNNISLSKFI
jgi:predicted glycoside hydrolase/deacetylase ChbG (UPF0249 family)